MRNCNRLVRAKCWHGLDFIFSVKEGDARNGPVRSQFLLLHLSSHQAYTETFLLSFRAETLRRWFQADYQNRKNGSDLRKKTWCSQRCYPWLTQHSSWSASIHDYVTASKRQHAGVSSGGIKDGSLDEVEEEFRDSHRLVTMNGDFSVKGLSLGLGLRDGWERPGAAATTRPAAHWRLTGDLLDLVDHHKGIRQAHLHRVVHGADLRHLDRNLKQEKYSILF